MTGTTPCKPEDCDRCAGQPSPHHNYCADCLQGLQHELHLVTELTYGEDPKGRRWLDRIPADPRNN